MLDSETKRRIDTARDILVGKVPDPKSQVEQITIALIYKFMNDMDTEAEELGGKRKFFVGEYEKYSWAKLMSPSLGGFEVLSLYSESIEKMTRNNDIPSLFRDIFKNAYLPYRDPETLKLFLKTINEFNYSHSEKLGDAFEYLLSVLGSQGDAGQFRTPRHIIEFMVKVINPQKDETILDPACGTAGFLISAYKHILENNSKDGKVGAGLKPAERKKLADNIFGYDISPDMVRLSLVNLYLHGFATPNILEYDSLSSEERWHETADVILANPPFMSPKGGIKPHKRFSVQSNRSEVLFVDYMAEHLTPNGRAAIIVPEGIIFQSAGAYKQLRKYLVENNYLWAVVSLPAGVFNPYAGVKTSILFLDKALAKKTQEILFVKVEADGFDLGAQRRPIDRNDLPDALNTLQGWHNAVLDGNPASFSPTIDSALLVSTSRLAENEDYNLSADRYRESTRNQHKTYSMVKLGEIAELVRGITFNKQDQLDYETADSIRVATTKAAQEEGIIEDDLYYVPKSKVKSDEKLLQEGDILISTANSLNLLGRTTYVPKLNYKASFGAFMTLIRAKKEIVNPVYLLHCLRTEQAKSYYLSTANTTTNISNLTFADLNAFQIPLPPLEIQRQIVDEIAAHQRIIDGARQVVEGWKPFFEVNYDWDVVGLDSLCSIKHGFAFKGEEFSKSNDEKLPIVLTPGNFAEEGGLYFNDRNTKRFSGKVDKEYLFCKGDLVIVMTDLSSKMKILGNPAIIEKDNILHNQRIGKVILHSDKVLVEYLHLALFAQDVKSRIQRTATGTLIKHTSPSRILECKIPLPPLEIQREIVARIEREQSIVEGNRELIRLYEEKVKKVIERVWEG